MSTLKTIRKYLGLSQEQLGAELGCTQGNVWQIEKGKQGVSRAMAEKLIQIAQDRGLAIDHRHIYAGLALPPKPENEQVAGMPQAA